MSFATELVKIRRMLRDPAAAIWSDAFLRHLFNDVQNDFQHRTHVLEGVHTQRIPGLYHASYMFDWEWKHVAGQVYQCLNLHDDYAYCHRWEPQEITEIDSDAADYGVHFSQPWEAFMGATPGDPVRIKFPANFRAMRFAAYDESPIYATTRKLVQSRDPSHVETQGDPIAYYPVDDTDNSYVLYPRPSVAWVNEIDGDGVALFADGDTEDTTTGTIAVRSGSYDTGTGAAVDIVDVEDSLFMVYEVVPTEISSHADVPDYPEFLRKYIRFGVISRAYGGNNDGRIRSLSDLWALRYEMGVRATRRYVLNRRQDRDYRLGGGRSVYRSRHPKLPSTYPQ